MSRLTQNRRAMAVRDARCLLWRVWDPTVYSQPSPLTSLAGRVNLGILRYYWTSHFQLCDIRLYLEELMETFISD